MTKFAVLGAPIGHSLSPIIHQTWFLEHGIAATYERIEVMAEGLEAMIARLMDEGYGGCNLTMPLKEVMIPYLDQMTQDVRDLQAVNTLKFNGGEIYGFNTDIRGFADDLIEKAERRSFSHAVILGAGGAARAVLNALKLYCTVDETTIIARNLLKAHRLANEFEAKIDKWEHMNAAFAGADLVVNATPLGMKGMPPLVCDVAVLPERAFVYDLVYNPSPTALVKECYKRHLLASDGLGMLLKQAALSFEIWTGQKPHVTPALVKKLREALALNEGKAG
jgi:shikimate dehydrogenase